MNRKSKCCGNVQAFAAIVLIGIGVATALPAVAQSYPSKPIRVIVPFPPGGANDIVARIVNIKLPGLLGQNLIMIKQQGIRLD